MRTSLPYLLAAVLLTVACKGGDSEAPDPTVADMTMRDEPLIDEEEELAPPSALTTPDPVPVERPPRSIFRSEVVRVTAFGPAYLLREVGPEPFRHGGRFVGWEITKVFPDDPALCDEGCDLQPGDVVLSVNGSRLETPQQLSDEFDKLPELSKLVVVSLRNGKRRSATYAIVEDLRQ